MTFSSLLRFITYSSGMWTKTVGEELSFSSVSWEAIFCVTTSKKGRKKIPFIFIRGENALKLNWPLKTLLHDKGPVWELLAAQL